MSSAEPQFVSAAEIARNFGMWQDKAAGAPIIVTSHGRPRVAIVAIDDYERLARNAASGADTKAAAEVAILLDQISEAFVAFDTQLKLRRINAAARVYWGASDNSVIGTGLVHAFPMLDDGLIVGHLRRALASREEVGFDAPSHLYPDRLLRFRAFPYPGGVAVLFGDVSAELESQRDAARRVSLRAAGEAHGEIGTAQLTVRGTFAQADRPFAAIAGLSVAKLLRSAFTDILPLGRRERIAAELDAVMTGAGPCAFDEVLATAAGERRVRIALAEVREGFAISGATVLLTAAR